MGIFDFFRPQAQLHPEFGPLHYARGRWHGVILLELEKRVALLLPGPRRGPSLDGLRFAASVPKWWAQVRPQVEAELLEHYSAIRDAGVAGVPRISTLGEIWSHVTLSSVEVQPYGVLNEMQVALRVEWDDEHTLGALIRDGRLIELNGSILEAR